MADRLGSYSFTGQHYTELEKENQSRLREAIRLRNINLVKHLVDKGTQVNDFSLHCSHHTLLHLSVLSRSLEITKILLDAGANINYKSYNEDTPLTLAAKLGNIPIMDLLLSHNVLVAANTHDNLNHMHIACMRNKVDVVRKLLLLSHKKYVDEAVSEQSVFWASYTPLHFAVRYGCIETIKFLLDCGADFTVKDAKEMTPLHLADYLRNDEAIDLILMAHRYVLKNPSNAQGLSHFHIACTRDNPQIVEHFLKSGVDVDLRVTAFPWKKWQSIHLATYYRCPNVVELLVKTRIHLGCLFLYSLLEFPLRIGDRRIYDLISLRRTGFVPIHEMSGELSNFHQACIQNDARGIESLLSEANVTGPSNLNEPIWTGCSPAHLAIRYRSTSVVKFLLDKGVDFMMQDAEGKTPLHIAFELNYFDLIDIITMNSNIFSKNLTDNSGISVFHVLCSTDKIKIIEYFLSQGVDVNAQVGENSALWAGFTPIHFAIYHLQSEVVDLLLKYSANISLRNVSNLNPFDLLTERLSALNHHTWDRVTETKISKILMIIFSSRPDDVRKFDRIAISSLHALCFHDEDEDLALLRQHLILHKDEINKLTDMPNNPSPSFGDFYKSTALHFALRRGLLHKANLLLENGADPLLVNGRRETPLECAAEFYETWEDLPKTEPTYSPETPIELYKASHFHFACIAGLLNIVKSLLNKAEDKELKMKFINSRNDDGETPLHSVIATVLDEFCMNQITHVLLENGSNVDARDLRLRTPLHLAVLRRNVDVIRTLISYGADVNAQDLYGQTPLHLICKSLKGKNKDALVLLLDNGADINIVNGNRFTCLVELINKPRTRIRDDPNDDSNDCYIVLLEHVEKLQTSGFYVNLKLESHSKLSRRAGDLYNKDAFINRCKRELELMMSMNIDSSTTLHDILFKSLKKMIPYRNNPILQTLVDSREFYAKFPIYGYVIRLQLRNGKIREPLLKESEESFAVLSKHSLPSVCVETILQYLRNTDLQRLILAQSN